MRHHRGPTRFLDWTYSPYVAAKFALDSREEQSANTARRDGVVWCLNTSWLEHAVGKIIGRETLRRWNKLRDEPSFRGIFFRNSGHQDRFVYTSNPAVLNERLSIQQGLFLCPADASHSFLGSLRDLAGHEDNIVRLRLDLGDVDLRRFAGSLLRMNVHSASLFPGLDGLAESLGERIVRLRSRPRSAG
jgi:hypothetical protein